MEQKNEYEFIERTQKLIEQYKMFNVPTNEYYDVTLLLNATVGLLIIEKEKYSNKLPNEKLASADKTKWGICANDINLCEGKGGKRIPNICRHIRNSIAHCNFRTISKNKIITKIIFKDYRRNSTVENFDMTISVDSFRTFAMKISEVVLNQLIAEKKQINK